MRLNAVLLVAIALVVSIPAFAIDQVTLSTGEVLRGELVAQDDATVTLEHPVLGTLKIARQNVTTVAAGEAAAAGEGEKPDPPQPPTGEGDAKPAEGNGKPDDVKVPEAPPVYDSILEGWKSQFELSFAGQDGDSKSLNFRVGFVSERKTPVVELKFDASAYIETDDNDTTTERATTGLRAKWPLDSLRWFGFAQTRFDYDRFKDWDHRVTGAAGLGYHFIQSEKFTLTGRVGAGFNKEFGDEADDLTPEALAGLDIDWKINDSLHLTVENTYYPDISDFMESRLVTDAALVIGLHEKGTFQFKLGIQNEYESRTEDDSKHNDLRYFGALVVKF